MKNPEKCLFVVIGCYILATMLSMVTDIYHEPRHSLMDLYKERLSDLYINSGLNNNYTGSVNASKVYKVSRKRTTEKWSGQPIGMLRKNTIGSILNNISKNVTLDPSGRRLILRRNLQDQGTVHLDYSPFRHLEPSFASEEDRAIFHMNKAYVADLQPIPRERLQGAIAWIPNGTISRTTDCGWSTPLEKFQTKDKHVSKAYHHIICPLLVPDGNSFQHFMDGVLPKLIQAYEYIIPEDVKLLIYTPRDSIIYEMLNVLGFKQSQLLYYQGGTYHADAMINTCITPPLHPDLWQTARRMIGAPEELEFHPRKASVILLTRARHHNPGRSMTNSDDVLHFLLHRYGNNAIFFKGGYSLAQSIEIFGRAKIIIGVHGGAFYNMLYAPKGTNIVEVMPTDINGLTPHGLAHTIVWHMAALLEQPYWRIPEKPLTKTMNNVQLNIAKLKIILDKIDKRFDISEQ